MPKLCLKVENGSDEDRARTFQKEGIADKGSGEEHPGGQRDCKLFKSCWRLTCQVGRSVEAA